MTTFSAIPSGDVDPDSPVTTGLITKLRDNHLAQGEGDPTAPLIQNLDRSSLKDAVAGSELTTELPNGVVIGTTFLPIGGNVFLPYGGTFTINFSGEEDPSASGNAEIRVYKNDVAFGTLRTFNTTSPVAAPSEDLTFVAGDVVRLYARHTNVSGGGGATSARMTESVTRLLTISSFN